MYDSYVDHTLRCPLSDVTRFKMVFLFKELIPAFVPILSNENLLNCLGAWKCDVGSLNWRNQALESARNHKWVSSISYLRARCPPRTRTNIAHRSHVGGSGWQFTFCGWNRSTIKIIQTGQGMLLKRKDITDLENMARGRGQTLTIWSSSQTSQISRCFPLIATLVR